MIKSATLCTIALSAMFTLLAFTQPVHAQDRSEPTTYRCPPCGCNQDAVAFAYQGNCPSCNMQLVALPKGITKKLDHHLAPYLETGMLGAIYTKLIYPIFAIGILLSLFLLLKGLRGRSLNVYLTGIILVLSLYGFKNQLYAVNYSLTNTYKSLFTPISFIVLLGPLLFLYIKSLTTGSFKWHRKYLYHFVPGVLVFLYYAILAILPEEIKLKFMFSPFEVLLSHSEQIIAVLLGGIYLFFAARSYNRWKAGHPVRNTRLTSWVFRFLLGLALMFTFWGGMILANLWIYDFGVATVSYNPLWLAMGITLLWLGVEIASNPKFFLLNKSTNLVNGNRMMTGEELSNLKDGLKGLMVDQKLYTDPNLSLNTLALALDINPKYLSMMLNNSLGKNFYDFINEYRIEDIKKRLADGSNRNLTIEAIANQAGFRSKSSFNAAFKKQLGMTPREFMKQGNP